ncbi:hypothetical protein PGTUg99_033467 [Puccinia graminis f. sp. tritici]|uniref:Alpha/beta hydrolase fold-3 domain-containing protein n=1 Tax=Puccinia graminis f. sp. tritici TaxID=56615 RepID=A0A5B0P2Q0_PUCGR|nr:hypothetical protein PGTUg99_033467 [Puccinia graminis f. sp. tritici]
MIPFLKSSTTTTASNNNNNNNNSQHTTTASASNPTPVSATTSIPSKNQTGTRLPTSPSALKSLLAPFNSIPTTDQSTFHSPSATTQPTPTPTTSSASSTSTTSSSHSNLSSPKTPSQPIHSHSIQPPTSAQITTGADQTGGPHSNLIQANNPLAKYSPAARIPGTSRIGIDLAQRSASPQISSVRNAWQYLPFLTKQATNIASSFVSHHLKGPPKKSWGIEMTIFTAIVREMANYTHLSSIHQLRTLMDFGQILPTPKDGIITPVSFKVKPHKLTGFLKELDQAEKGDRILTGEWVVSKKTWKRMQTESLARRSQNRETAKDYGFAQPTEHLHNSHHQHGLGQDKVIYFIHGGAYFIMSASTHRPLTISIAKYTECRLFAINYRLAPETKFPGPLHDAVAGYFRLLNDLCIPAQNIVVAGDSAGGGLVMALLMYLRDEGYPLPSAAMLYSPWCDLTMSCDSWETNQPYDFLPMPKPDDPLNPVKCYLGEEGIKKWITHPYVSPLFGDMHGLPPLLIQAGDAEVLRDEITLLAHKASLHGVKVIHEIYEDCVHVFQAFLFLESSTKALQSMRNYIRHVLPRMTRRAGQPSETVIEETYRPPTRSPSEDDDQSIYANGDPNQGAVDREISRDAHLVDDMSQTIQQTLPPTPAVPNLLGSEEDEVSDSEEVLSADEESGEEDEVLDASAEQAGPTLAHEQELTNPFASGSDSLAPSSSVNLPRSASNLSLSRAAGEKRKVGLSLRGRLPPAMDIETIQNLILSTPHHEFPPESVASSTVEEPSDYQSPTSLKEDLRKLNVSHSTASSPRRTSLQPAPMIPIHSNAGPRASSSDQPASPGESHHVRRHSAYQTATRPTHSRKYTASNVALLTPMVRAHDHGGPETVNADVQAIFHNLITTPSELRTTVYTQGDDEDEEQDTYFRNFNSSSSQPQFHSHHHHHHHQQQQQQKEEEEGGGSPGSVKTPTRTENSAPSINQLNSAIHPASSSSDHLPLPSDHNQLVNESEDLDDQPPPSPEFAFQTPGYGFS